MKVGEAEILAGRVIVAGFDDLEPPVDLIRSVRRGALGGVVLFARNVESVEQVADLIAGLRGAAPEQRRPLVAIDQEGGRVVRVREPLTVLPTARTIGAVDRPELTRRAGELVGSELRALGVTVDFAPVLDVDTNPSSPVIGDRSYGSSPATVARHGLAFARGLGQGGVHACAKHFPGHGDAVVDSHLSLPRVEHDRERLERVELAPFAAWAQAGLGPVMSAHVVYPALDEQHPATTSGTILTSLLRQRLGFESAVLTDDLEMGAVDEVGGPSRTALAALRAGADGLLVCRRDEVRAEVCQAVASAAVDDRKLARRLRTAAERLRPLAQPPGGDVELGWIGSPAHLERRSQLIADLGS
jgi:beta-N-acetylhexosaminidase